MDDKESLAALHKAVDLGVNFFDTADVYGNGRSEKLIGKLLRERSETIYVATKAGTEAQPRTWRRNTHRWPSGSSWRRACTTCASRPSTCCSCTAPPTQVYYTPELFAGLDQLVKAGKLKNYGVSVEKVEEALKAIEYPGVKTVQIIFNMFRQRPAELFFREAKSRWVGIIARVPLASGMLTGQDVAGHAVPLRRPPRRSTARGRPSTGERHSPAWTTPGGWRRWRSCARSCRTA